MEKELKYTEEVLEDGIGTSNGFAYDIFEGGYIKPSEVLLDQVKAKQLEDAIELIENWKAELEEDEVLNEY